MTTSGPPMERAPERRTPFSRRRDPMRAPFPRRGDAADRIRRLTDRARAELSGNRLARRTGRDSALD
jgi:hypothetical protein